MLRRCSLGALVALVATTVADAQTPSAAQQTALQAVTARTSEINEINRAIWEFAEIGLEERKSSALLVQRLKAAGFQVRTGVADMPTAFVAEFGSGQPVIAILAEYDALPDLSQKVSPTIDPLSAGAPGHGCGHSGLGAGAFGAAVAVKVAMEKHKLPGTIRLYGTPAEETVIGKVYMTLAGLFDDVDVCLHWHPSAKNEIWNGGSKAMISAKFTFTGVAAHASGNPDQGRSALDAVELMNVGVNFMREHVKEDARLHYVITSGGGAPNVVPATATVWYYVRANGHSDVEQYFAWVQDIAKGAALMSQTKLSTVIDTDCHELIPNTPLAELIQRNLQLATAPKFTSEEHAFARRLQEPLIEQFGTKFTNSLDEKVHPLPTVSELAKGSTDVGDISWHLPTCGLRTTCFPAGSPGHCWQNVASIGSTIGEKGTVYAAQALAGSAIELFEHPDQIAAAKADFQQRMKDRKYTTLIPKGQKPPLKIR
ncbi:MAG: amidohydrolase [Planctomycetaceae bacterium]|nr:amidohydrolase [Planctomycetaceae bacterium]